MKKTLRVLIALGLALMPVVAGAQTMITVTWNEAGESPDYTPFESYGYVYSIPVTATTTQTTGQGPGASTTTVECDPLADVNHSINGLTPLTGGTTLSQQVMLTPTDDDEDAELTFGFSHGNNITINSLSPTDYSLTPACIEFTVSAQGGERKVYADLYYVVDNGEETLLEENIPISTKANKPTTVKRALPFVELTGGESYKAKLKFHWDDSSQDEEEEELPFENLGIYMLQSVETGYYVGGGNVWGTQASMLPQPQQFTFDLQDDGLYKLWTYQQHEGVGTGYFGYKESEGIYYIDQDKSGAEEVTFIPGAEEGTYYVSLPEEDGTKYFKAGSNYGPLEVTSNTSEASLFRIISQADLVAAQEKATAISPVDVTGLINNPTLNRGSENRNTDHTYWTTTTYDGTGTTEPSFGYDDGNNSQYNWANVVANNGSSDGIDIYQTLTLKAGTYRFSLHGFYYNTTTAEALMQMYAKPTSGSSVTVDLTSNKDESAEGAKCYEDNNWPTMVEAYADFRDGYYLAEADFTVREDDTPVQIGVKAKDGTWYCFGELNLTYYGTVNTGDVVRKDEDELNHWSTDPETLTLNEDEETGFYQYKTDGTDNNAADDGLGNLANAVVSHNQVADLPVGRYLVSIEAYMTADGTTAPAQGTTLLKANSSNLDLCDGATVTTTSEGKTTVGGSYTLLANVLKAGTLDVCFDIYGADYQELSWRNFDVYYVGMTMPTFTAVEGNMNSDVAARQAEALAAYNEAQTADNYVEVLEAIEAAQASADLYASIAPVVEELDVTGLQAWNNSTAGTAYNDNTLIVSQQEQVNKDLAEAQKAQTLPGSDMTYVALYEASWVGKTLAETCPDRTTATQDVTSSGYSTGDTPLKKTLTGLTPGVYTISFYAFVNSTAGHATGDDIAVAYANEQTKPITVGSAALVGEMTKANIVKITTTVDEDRTLEFGIRNTADGGDWAVGEVVSLTYNDVEKLVAIGDVSLTVGLASYSDIYQTAMEEDAATYYLGEMNVQHKPAKWFSMRQNGVNYGDDFSENEDEQMLNIGTDEDPLLLQDAHCYVDTIYMQKGTYVKLVIPTYRQYEYKSDYFSSETPYHTYTATYQRWFNFLNDRNYYYGENVIQKKARGKTKDDELSTFYQYDLLTFPTDGSYNQYRFANGYVSGVMNGQFTSSNNSYQKTMTEAYFYYPTDAEFEELSEGRDNFDGLSNAYYAVACDMSLYTDFSESYTYGGTNFGSTKDEDGWVTFWEPTIALRSLYYIIGVDKDETTESGVEVPSEDLPSRFKTYWNVLMKTEYQGGGDDVGKKYLRDYVITVPSRRVSTNTMEFVHMTKDPDSYGIAGEMTPGELSVSLPEEENSAGIKLKTTTLSGTERAIFYYVGDDETAQWYVNDGDTATILVTKTVGETTYNICRFKLTFKDDCIPLTAAQLDALKTETEEEESKYWWGDMTYRTQEFLDKNFTLIASRSFDYDQAYDAGNVLNGGMTGYYPFPLGFNESGYAFLDGSSSADVFYSSNGTEASTNWGMYSLVDEYIGYGDKNQTDSPTPKYDGDRDRGYFIYVDATQTPGTLVDLNLGNLCRGSQLVATAWIKSCGQSPSTYTADDGAVVYTVCGVTAEGQEIPLYKQYSGQLETTTFISTLLEDEISLDKSVVGKGSGTNEWYQNYLEFITPHGDYDHYTFRIDNSCASSDGGDFYLDDVRVYVKQPTPEVEEISPIVNGGLAKIRVDIDYELLLNRATGNNSSEYDEDSEEQLEDVKIPVGIAILDKIKYDEYIAQGYGEDEAIKYAAAKIYDSEDDTDGHYYKVLTFESHYEENEVYDEDNFESRPNVLLRRLSAEGLELLSVFFYTNLSPYTPYYVVLMTNADVGEDIEGDEEHENDWFYEFTGGVCTACAVANIFSVTSVLQLRINGELVDATATLCAGQVYRLNTQIAYKEDYDSDEDPYYLNDVYCDWFYGTVDEFVNAPAGNSGGTDETEELIDLHNALLHFRSNYPDSDTLVEPTEEDMEEETPSENEDDEDEEGEETVKYNYTEQDYNSIKYWLDKDSLVLHKKYLDVLVSEADENIISGGIRLVVQPTEEEYEIEEVDEDGNVVGTDTVTIPRGYVPLAIEISSSAPQIWPGFFNVEGYPDGYIPSIRMSQKELLDADKENPVTINLRNVEMTGLTDATQLALVEGEEKLYLVDTNDPYYLENNDTYHMMDADFDQYSLEVGEIADFYAMEIGEEDNMMKVYFTDEETYPFHEGYYYTVAVHFREDGDPVDGAGVDGSGDACYGVMPIEIKVVPEYLVWQGDEDNEWNNDSNWKMVDKEVDLDKLTYKHDYLGVLRDGFVPLDVSKVVIPQDTAVIVYRTGFEKQRTDKYEWNYGEGDDEDVEVDKPAEETMKNIMFDIQMQSTKGEDGSITGYELGRYKAHVADEVMLENKAMLLHPELLGYNKMWMDVSVPESEWTLLAMPLDGVVSGDWYTNTDGSESAQYFTDITYDTDKGYNRTNPLVFQRSWGEGTTIVVGSGSEGDAPAYATTGWTSVYNDAAVASTAGTGFSMKLLRSTNTTGNNSVFRFPKADEIYVTATSIDRGDNAGKLLVSKLTEENDDGLLTLKDDAYVEATLSTGKSGFAIVGNPFTSRMSLRKFMEVNGTGEDGETGVIAGAYTNSNVAIGPSGNVTSTEDADELIEPYAAFFVKVNEVDVEGGATEIPEKVTVRYTADMQVLEAKDDSESQGVHIIAQSEGGTTGAALLFDEAASDDYKASEDAIVLQDITWQRSDRPLVYSVAGDKAVSINCLRSLDLIPIGVFASDSTEYTLTFKGMDYLTEPVLYDAEEKTETPLSEGYELELTGATHGRYFIKVGSTEEMEDLDEGLSITTVYSAEPRKVTVSSSDEIETVTIYTIGGMLVSRTAPHSVATTIDGINSGIAVVRVQTTNGVTVRKIRVK